MVDRNNGNYSRITSNSTAKFSLKEAKKRNFDRSSVNRVDTKLNQNQKAVWNCPKYPDRLQSCESISYEPNGPDRTIKKTATEHYGSTPKWSTRESV
ncbi:hypothetical protein NPIL_1971 [Nephila pilipes]|uniref:Uncharacterized protein n=1 Tax=Nephila pilipes TaxID=299642 RepID=A0A8X6PWZ7_NEPPI|nr:hypothetical protein NPIL_1971 [Nephila pilipes]